MIRRNVWAVEGHSRAPAGTAAVYAYYGNRREARRQCTKWNLTWQSFTFRVVKYVRAS